ncbi:MAG TPA: type II CAAX endopeptidase family protein [Bacilli bacterium]|nr:type II CAAX endopeptidase family protein [Bacilli bacterium]
MYCKKCGNYIDESDTIICDDCAKIVSKPVEETLDYYALKKSIFLYFILFVVGSLVSGVLAGMFYVILNPGQTIDPDNLPVDYIHFVAGISQLLTYILITTVSIIVLKAFIKIDWEKTKGQIPTILLHGFLGWILILLAAVAAGYILILFGIEGDSANQTEIINLVRSDYGFLMVIVTLFGAPIVEELIFRKAMIDGLERTKRFSTPVIILLSSLLFASIHIVAEATSFFSGDSTLQESLLGLAQILPYLFMGAALGFIYKKANNNIFVPMIAHFFQNAFSMLATLGFIELTSILPFFK